MKKKNSVMVRFLLILAVLLAVGITYVVVKMTPTKKTVDLVSYLGEGTDESSLIILGTEVLEERGQIREGEPYLPLSLVKERLNEAFYWDADNRQILYATPSEVLRTDSAEVPGGDVLVSGDEVYLRGSFVSAHTDLDVTAWQEPSRIVIQNSFRDLTLVQPKKSASVRIRGGIKAEILSKQEAGAYLILTEELEDWLKVDTPDGFSGYVRKKEVGEPYVGDIPRSFVPETVDYLTMDGPVNLVWDVVSNQESNDYFSYNTQSMTGVNVISPTWFSLSDNTGSFTDLSSAAYVQSAHERGLQVWGLLDNFSADVSTYEILSHTASRERLIQGLIDAALRVGLDGLNIDLETLSADAVPHVLEFLRELSIQTHRNGLILSFDDPVPENYTGYYNRAEQARVADYIVIMGYDEHYNGSESPGSVASLPWVEQGILDTLEETPADRTVLALPFYTRAWYVQAGTTRSTVVSMAGQEELLAGRNAQTYWNTELFQNVATWEQDGLTYQMWMEDEQSIAAKVDLAVKYGLAGVAGWRLGLEKNSIWQVITEHLSLGA